MTEVNEAPPTSAAGGDGSGGSGGGTREVGGEASKSQKIPSRPPSSSMPKKVRFDGLDVAAMTAHVRRTLLGHRLANVYDGLGGGGVSGDKGSGGDKNTFLFKLAGTGGAGQATAESAPPEAGSPPP